MKNSLINDLTQTIGLDVGRSFVKVYSEYDGKVYSTIFPSIIGDSRSIKFDDYEYPICINDLFVGEIARKESYNPTRNSSDSKTSLTVRTLIYAALSEVVKSNKVKIMLGVPNNMYKKSVLLDVINTYQNKMISIKNNIDNSSKNILIEAIDIFREADAVAYDVMRDKINDKDAAFISIGFRSSEISYFEKGMNYVDRLSKTISYANQDMLGYVQNKLKDDYDITKELYEIDSNEGDYDELKKMAYEIASESFVQRIEGVIKNGFIETNVYIAGGTALNLTLDNRFNLVEDPQMSVARGLYYVGTLVL